jgi:hypothetical protein
MTFAQRDDVVNVSQSHSKMIFEKLLVVLPRHALPLPTNARTALTEQSVTTTNKSLRIATSSKGISFPEVHS